MELCKHNIHVASGVKVETKDLPYLRDLSYGWKYLFPTRSKPELVFSAWRDLKDRLRWRNFFFEKSLYDGPTPYDPDLAVKRHIRTPFSQAKSNIIEWALSEGDKYVNDFVSSIPTHNQDKWDATIPVKSIQEWLEVNNFLVLPTDKNLGLALVRRNWVSQETMALLRDTNNYHRLERNDVIDLTNMKINDLVRVTGQLSRFITPSIKKFLLQHVPSNWKGRFEAWQDGNVSSVTFPEFYGIPKIHKTPTKFRPIAPCHSALQNPMAKFVSKILKPFIRETTELCVSSREFCHKLSRLHLSKHKSLWLVSGDIVAYYPNIPMDDAIKRITELTTSPELWDSQECKEALSMKMPRDLWQECLELACKDLIVRHEGIYYLQISGIAMGVACAPDIAMLYCQNRDRACSRDRRVINYTRFIDDVFAIVEAESALLAQAVVQTHWRDFGDGIRVEWAAPGKYIDFLDVSIALGASNSIMFFPYRKALNHHERIPWCSSHPYDVKRGCFIGECARLAALSSSFRLYHESIKKLIDILLSRGYPPKVLSSWTKKYLCERWDKRYDKVVNPVTEYTVLKTEYNEIWNSFDMEALKARIMIPFSKVSGAWNDMELGSPDHPLNNWEDYPVLLSLPERAKEVLGPSLERVLRKRPVVLRTGESTRLVKEAWLIDYEQVLFGPSKWLVSRKRTFSLGDFLRKHNKKSLHKLGLQQRPQRFGTTGTVPLLVREPVARPRTGGIPKRALPESHDSTPHAHAARRLYPDQSPGSSASAAIAARDLDDRHGLMIARRAREAHELQLLGRRDPLPWLRPSQDGRDGTPEHEEGVAYSQGQPVRLRRPDDDLEEMYL